MLLIHCPWCGPRDEIEFRCGGESHIARPGPPEAVSDERWADYLFNRINPKAIHYERWVHRAGCRQWFNIARDTRNHQILAVYPLEQEPPSLEAAGVVP
jgi:sarcosine oxidase, subunit delta